MKTYVGSCHCQKLTFEADIDLSAGTAKCNCSVCTKSRAWEALIKPDAFRLLTDETLGDYQFGKKNCHHLFCTHCGVKIAVRGNMPEAGGEFVAVSLVALDNLELTALIEAPVRYFNGRDNDWGNTPAEVRHL